MRVVGSSIDQLLNKTGQPTVLMAIYFFCQNWSVSSQREKTQLS